MKVGEYLDLSDPGRGALLSCPCQAVVQRQDVRLSAVQPTMVGFLGGHWGLCNKDMKGAMGGYCTVPSVSIFGYGH